MWCTRPLTSKHLNDHRLTAVQYPREMASRFATWNEVVGLPAAA